MVFVGVDVDVLNLMLLCENNGIDGKVEMRFDSDDDDDDVVFRVCVRIEVDVGLDVGGVVMEFESIFGGVEDSVE